MELNSNHGFPKASSDSAIALPLIFDLGAGNLITAWPTTAASNLRRSAFHAQRRLLCFSINMPTSYAAPGVCGSS
jgi:hypothetical protein